MDELKVLLIALVIYTACHFVAMRFLKLHLVWVVPLGLLIGVGTARVYKHLKGEN